ncbi:MAG: autotransporter outer membrane beta-barrel domain-containing protein [Planctomycetota bacterium]
MQDGVLFFENFSHGEPIGACTPPPPGSASFGYAIEQTLYVGERKSETGETGNADFHITDGSVLSRLVEIGAFDGARSIGRISLFWSRLFISEKCRVGTRQSPQTNPDKLSASENGGVMIGQTLEILESGVVSLASDGFIQVGSLIDDGGLLGAVLVRDFGVLQGNGTIEGIVAMTGSSTLSPGTSPGTLTINGDLSMEPGVMLNIELGGTAPGEFDQLVVSGHVAVGGTVNVSFVDGFAPSVGDSFPVMQFGSQEGTFSKVVMPPGYAATGAGGEKTLSIVVTSVNPSVPAVSVWGLIALSLLVLAAGTVVLRSRFGSNTA